LDIGENGICSGAIFYIKNDKSENFFQNDGFPLDKPLLK